MENFFLITFEIQYPTKIGEQILISGDCEELGNWKKHMKLVWHEGHIWSIQLKMAHNKFQYKHIYARAGDPCFNWEAGVNRVVDVALLKGPKILKAKWEEVKISFMLYNPPYDAAKGVMRVNGTIPELGEWEKKPVNMNITKSNKEFNNSKMWKRTITLNINRIPSNFKYKYTYINFENKVVTWEREPSRVFKLKSATSEGLEIINNKIKIYDANFVTGMNYNKIGEHSIYIGPYPQTVEDINVLIKEKVTAVLNVQTKVDIINFQLDWPRIQDYYSAHKIKLVHIPINDFNEIDLIDKLPMAVDALNILVKDGHTVYVHCTAGMGRAPAVVVLHLCMHNNMSPEEGYNLVHSYRECATPNKHAIQEVYNKLHPK